MRVFDFNAAIVRLPGHSVVNGLRAHAGPAPRYEGVLAEHAAYVAALRAAGVQVTVLEPLEQFPDSVFVEDPALVFSDVALKLRPGAPTRRAEAEALSATLRERFARVLELAEGFADGGDILVTPGRIFIGLSARTDEPGAGALRRLLASIGRGSKVMATPRGTLHLKSDCALLDEDTLLATRTLAESGMLEGFRVLIVPEEERAAANALRVNDTVFVREDCPRTVELLIQQGLSVVTLPVTQIALIDAGLSCMSLRWFDPARRPRRPVG
jgi:dimethylargininase